MGGQQMTESRDQMPEIRVPELPYRDRIYPREHALRTNGHRFLLGD
jgi:hypothetical protein